MTYCGKLKTSVHMWKLIKISSFGDLTAVLPQDKKKIPHTGDTDSLDRCGSLDQIFFSFSLTRPSGPGQS